MNWRNVLLTVVVLGVVAGTRAPSVLAATKADEKSSDKATTLFDPFALRTVVLTGGELQAPINLTRQAIRIPFRPALRSEYQPTLY